MNQRAPTQPTPVRTLEEAIIEGERSLAVTPPGCSAVVMPYTLRLLLDAARLHKIETEIVVD